LFNPRETLSRNLSEKWNQVLSPNFKLKWWDVWTKKRSRKEACFLWSLWHKGPCCKYLESKNKSQHPSRLSLLWTWNLRNHHA
jgi:hypothetical protein